jgi:hypothetical protein
MIMMIIIIMCMLQAFLQRSAAASDVRVLLATAAQVRLSCGLVSYANCCKDRTERKRGGSAEGIAFVDVIIVIVIIP